MLYRVAKKHRSQALEADALHFSTDIWSSAVVVVGLAGVVISHHFPTLAWMQKTDAVAALFVAGIVLKVTGKLGGRTIHALLDATPDGDAIEKIKTTVGKIEGVYDCHAVRARHSGPVYFVDLHITVDVEKTLRSVHALADHVEDVVREILPDADVTVHPEPHEPDGPSSGT
jgi:cation diffusion facilitator family transporter